MSTPAELNTAPSAAAPSAADTALADPQGELRELLTVYEEQHAELVRRVGVPLRAETRAGRRLATESSAKALEDVRRVNAHTQPFQLRVADFDIGRVVDSLELAEAGDLEGELVSIKTEFDRSRVGLGRLTSSLE